MRCDRSSRTELASLVLSCLTLGAALWDVAPWREGERELAPLDGSEGRTEPLGSHLEGCCVCTASVGRLVTSHAAGITRLRQGRDVCSTPEARLRPTV